MCPYYKGHTVLNLTQRSNARFLQPVIQPGKGFFLCIDAKLLLGRNGKQGHFLLAAVPIISDGDVTGCVAFVGDENARLQGETEVKLAGAAAAFLGRQTEV